MRAGSSETCFHLRYLTVSSILGVTTLGLPSWSRELGDRFAVVLALKELDDVHKLAARSDRRRSKILAPDRDEGEKGDDQAVAVTDGIIDANLSVHCRFALVLKLLPKVEQLDAGDDGP
jgi:hypothetical protein